MTRKNSLVPHASPSRSLVAGTILMGIGMGIGLSQPAAALSPATRDQMLQACHEKAMQVHRDAQEALMTYLRRLAAQRRLAAGDLRGPATLDRRESETDRLAGRRKPDLRREVQIVRDEGHSGGPARLERQEA
ncbi:hypothetical protein ACFOYU_11955 [Microvirga sp. GCM10011540]|uniref:hypothetical protein n=1 Tax=Microvirga sp. GCM10011540 TaxID=3317338 RepID=UPI00361F9F69